ncbi:hypothetical protein QU487_04645 [Crenobacter sp. SG2305]|uniref:hypothetical protein n=1 Tax=Crenobacter oryzisoli TaxID=3056844 RepID=UPI0025AADBFB|nr:hypothetical protein [Crenobacter sp. SG2305]MDN0082043.1 hypothetical protein [Crenobacter sp. SG2305]
MLVSLCMKLKVTNSHEIQGKWRLEVLTDATTDKHISQLENSAADILPVVTPVSKLFLLGAGPVSAVVVVLGVQV